MGTKGKKNTPITARVNAGLFNQKKGITEPLLNVGPAGVYGDNQTKDIPSPSKKRGYSMAKKKIDSPIKQVNTNVITLGEDTEGTEGTEDTVIKGNSGSQGFQDAFAEARKGGLKTFKFNGKDFTTELSTDPDFGKDKIIPGNKGSDPVEGLDEVDSIPIKTKDDNDAMSPWRVRQQSRSIKKSGKDVRQSQNKLDKINRKLAGMDAKDRVPGNRKFDRLTSKQTENTNELDAFNKNMKARTRQVEMSSDPLGKNRTFKSTERNLDKGDLTKEEQDTRNKKEIQAKKIREAAAAKAAKEKAASSTNPSGPMKTANSFFKSRSPMKKNYFK